MPTPPTRRAVRVLLVVPLVLVALLAAVEPASAHARLISTDPAGGATLDGPPRAVRLRFSERIETTFAGVQVFGPDRQRVEAGEARVEGERVIVPLRSGLPGGRYTVVFRIISADGHPVRSQFRFTVAPTVATPAPTEAPPSAAPTEASPSPAATQPPVDGSPADDPVFELEDAGPGTTVGLHVARILTYTALALVVGLLLAALYLMPTGYEGRHRRLVRRAGTASAAWCLAALVLFAYALSAVAARPMPEALNADLAGRFLETRFGLAVLVQAGIALVTAAVAFAAKSRTMALAALVLAVVGAAAIPWWGHAGTDELVPVALLSAFAHVIAAAAWVGGLVALVLFLPRDEVDLGETATRFSRLAALAIAVVTATGLVNAALHMGALENAWGTGWGRLVIAKLLVLGVIALFARRNRDVLLPRLRAGGSDARAAFRRFAGAEIVAMLVAFGLAAGLASGIPADAEAASRIQSVVSQFGDGQVNVTVDPAEVGTNLVHIYFFGPDGTQRAADNATLTFAGGGETVTADLLNAGTGHFTALGLSFPAAGEYEMRLSADIDGTPVTTTATIVIR